MHQPNPNPLPQAKPLEVVPPPPRAPSVLLLGPPGSGKSTSLVTIMESGLDLFAIITEPNGLESIVEAMRVRKVPAERLKYAVIEPARAGFDNLSSMATKVTQMGYDGLSKMAPTERSKAQFLKVVATFQNFTDERTGTAHGSVDHLKPNCAVALDSLSGLNMMAMDLTIGDKVTAHQGEWGVAMNMEEKLVHSLCSNLKALFVLTAHIEREVDEVSGGTTITAGALGRKLAPKLPRFFSEVVATKQEGANYYWSTTEPNMALKRRVLPVGNKLAPSFKPIIDAYNQRLTYLQNAQ